MTGTSLFLNVPKGPIDPMFDLKIELESDQYPEKIDLGAGVYRNEQGDYFELPVIKKAKRILEEQNPGHDYDLTTGNQQFIRLASQLLFGEYASDCIASVQTISGTGANHLGAVFARKFLSHSSGLVYIGTPAWGNYKPLFEHAGYETIPYCHYNDLLQTLDFEGILKTVQEAPSHSIFVLQGCCHNPTGMNFSQSQWIELASAMKQSQIIPFLDIAYQGFGDGLDEDAFGVRHFIREGFEMIVAQSFSKNMALYGERVGALHIVVNDSQIAENIKDQLRSLIRWEFSSSPAYGARLATIIMESDALKQEWIENVGVMRCRLKENRRVLHTLLVERYKTPGDWHFILEEQGLFSYLPLSAKQVSQVTAEFHIYLPASGRINVAGLNPSCFEKVAFALDSIIRRAELHAVEKHVAGTLETRTSNL